MMRTATVKLGGEPNQDRRHGRATVTGPMPPPILTPRFGVEAVTCSILVVSCQLASRLRVGT